MPDKPVSKDSPLTEADVGKMVRLRNGRKVGPLAWLGESRRLVCQEGEHPPCMSWCLSGKHGNWNGTAGECEFDIIAVIAPEPAQPEATERVRKLVELCEQHQRDMDEFRTDYGDSSSLEELLSRMEAKPRKPFQQGGFYSSDGDNIAVYSDNESSYHKSVGNVGDTIHAQSGDGIVGLQVFGVSYIMAKSGYITLPYAEYKAILSRHESSEITTLRAELERLKAPKIEIPPCDVCAGQPTPDCICYGSDWDGTIHGTVYGLRHKVSEQATRIAELEASCHEHERKAALSLEAHRVKNQIMENQHDALKECTERLTMRTEKLLCDPWRNKADIERIAELEAREKRLRECLTKKADYGMYPILDFLTRGMGYQITPSPEWCKSNVARIRAALAETEEKTDG